MSRPVRRRRGLLGGCGTPAGVIAHENALLAFHAGRQPCGNRVRRDLREFQRTSLERLKLAAEVILSEAEDCGEVVPNALESELVIFRERVEKALLLQDAEDIHDKIT